MHSPSRLDSLHHHNQATGCQTQGKEPSESHPIPSLPQSVASDMPT